MNIKDAVTRYIAPVPVLLVMMTIPAISADQLTLVCTIDKKTDINGQPIYSNVQPFIFQVDAVKKTVDGTETMTFNDDEIYWLANPSIHDHVSTSFDIDRKTHEIEVYFVDENMNLETTLMYGTCKASTGSFW
jgi:hypothetical protein